MYEFKRLGIEPGDYDEALEKVRTGKLAWVVISGKMASGKDTLAAELEHLPGDGYVTISYGDVLRHAFKTIVPIVRDCYANGMAPDMATAAIMADILGYSVAHAHEVALEAYAIILAHGDLDPWDRSNLHRKLLQRMGSDWLPDTDYLPRTAARMALEALEQGHSVVVTGGRYPEDVDLPRSAGAITVRLEFSRETQLARLLARDGLEPTPELMAQLNHSSEMALNHYPADIILRNDGPEGIREVGFRLQVLINDLLVKKSFPPAKLWP